MDYSTISNKTTFTEAEEFTNGELGERYYLLKKQFENLSLTYDTLKQELHDTKRSYHIALDTQSHLTVELENCQSNEQKRSKELINRITSLQEEISALREASTEITERHTAETMKLDDEIRRLKNENATQVLRKSPERDNTELDEAKVALNEALCDAVVAKVALEEAKAEIMSWRERTQELVNAIGEMREAAELRREELRVSGEREATALAELAEAKAMLHQCSTADSQPHAAKGNSIFAEVEDKRQEMAENLLRMKQNNSELRRQVASKQAELDALLYEKNTIWEQLIGAAAHHDRELIESYEERITQVEGLCERQRRELCRWFGKLCEPTSPGWLPAVLDHLKSECEQLRAEVLSRGAAQLASAAQVRELRRKIVQMKATGAAAVLQNLDINADAVKTETIDEKINDIEEVKPSVVQISCKSNKVATTNDVKRKVRF